MITFLGFTPDIEPDAPGGIIECLNIIPSDRGLRPRPAAVDSGVDALASACRGIVSSKKTDGNIRTVAGTASNLYDLTGTTWTSVLSGKTLGAEDRWRFAQFGNVTLAVTPTETVHYSTSGSFSAIAVAVKAEHIIAVDGFLIAANYNDGVDEIPDGWICSAYQDYLDWVPSPSTQCAYGRLLGTAGSINAAKRLGSNAVLYQEKSLYFGVYVGGAAVWSFQEVYGDIGCLASGLIVETEQFHLFFGNDDVYRFDGSNLVPLNAPCSRWVIDRLNKNALYLCQSAFDNDRGLAWWFYPSSNMTTCDSYVCLHVESGRWGYGLIDIEAAVQLTTGGFTYETAPITWTYDTAPTYPYDSSYWSAATQNLSIVGTDHKVATLSGAGVDSSFTMAEIGDDMSYSLAQRIYPRFFTQPSTATLTVSAKWEPTDSFSQVTTSDIYNGRFDFLSSALWHRFAFELTGDWEMPAIELTLIQDGTP
jgi:hypothetical protein